MKNNIHKWKSLSLIEEDVSLPNGQSIIHTTIVHPGAVVILPILENGQILTINQFRPSLNDWIIELPAGTIEVNEDPIISAMRELEEETGYSAQTFIPLGQMHPCAGFCDEIQYVFIARDLNKTQRLTCDDDEIIEVKPQSVETLDQWIVNGQITDSKTIACLYKAKLSGLI